LRSVESKDKKKEMHRIENLYDIEEHETACLHKSPSGRWFWTSQQRIKKKKIIPKLQTWRKYKNHKSHRNPLSCVSGYMKSVKSRRYWSDCTLVHETDAPGL
jgi:hypothetical protein